MENIDVERMDDDDMDYFEDWDGLFESCPNCSRSYDHIDYDYQSCSKCGWDAQAKKNIGKVEPTNRDYLNGDADVLTGQWY